MYQEDEEVSKLMEEVQEWEELNKQGKILAGSDEEKKYQAAVDKLQVAGDALAQKKIDMTIQEVNDLEDVNAMRTAVDAAITMQFYNQYSERVARYLADKNKEITVKPDPEYLANLRAKNAQELEMLREQNRKEMEAIRQSGRATSEEQKQENRIDIINKKETNIRTRPVKVNTTKNKTKATKSSDFIKTVTPYNPPSSTDSTIVITQPVNIPKKKKRYRESE
jgi:hypothetical protein